MDVRYVLIGLGLITLVLAVVLAREGLWWVAISDAFFGAGIPWVAWVSLQDEKRAHRRALRPEAEPALGPPPGPREAIEAAAAPAAELPPAAAPVAPFEAARKLHEQSGGDPAKSGEPPSPPLYPRPAPGPAHARSRRRKHR